MAKEVFMPKLSSTMAVGTLLQWFKEEGEMVEVGEPLFEIMTDKINIEVESYEEGILLKKYFQADEEVPVNGVIGFIGEEGEDVPEHPPEAGGDASFPAAEAEDTAEEADNSSDFPNASESQAGGKVRATPAARRVARENDLAISSIPGSGPKGRIHEKDVLESVNENRIYVTPLAEKIAAENGVDLREITGSGARGKIEKADVLAYIEAGEQKGQQETGQRIKLKGLRKAVADKMKESVSTIPHVTLTTEVDMSKAIEVRKALLPVIEKQTGYRLSYTEIIMKAAAQALQNHPRVNASLIGDEIVLNEEIHIGLAVAVEDGLIVPSVKQANRKGLAELTQTSKLLGNKARNNKLKPSEMGGSTFTISNLGMYAIDGFTPIINPPETAILGVGRINEKPVAVNGEIAIKPMMVLSLSFDHRSVDGAPAAAFLTELKETLENPYSLLV